MPSFFGKEVGRFTIPSGIVTTTTDTIRRIAEEIPEIGILTTKSIGPKRREGNKEPVLEQFDGERTFLNAVGLSNPGAEEFAKELKEIYPLPNGKFLLTSIFGSTAEEFQYVARAVAPYSDGLELNFSCPHAEKGYGATIGSSPELTRKFTAAVKAVVDIPVIVKLTPNVDNLWIIMRAAIDGGADGISAINTVGPFESQILSLGKGGMSGAKAKDKGIDCVRVISEVIQDSEREIPIIAIGGISDAVDVLDYSRSGATFFGIGSALAGMDTATIKRFFADLESKFCSLNWDGEDLTSITPGLMGYTPYVIRNIQQYAEDLKVFHFDGGITAKPGQFVFVKLKSPNAHEKPFSIADNVPLAIAVRRIGEFTSRMFELKQGDAVDVRGPYGNGFSTAFGSGTLCLVGGGTGLAPLRFLADSASKYHSLLIFMGGKTMSQLLFMSDFRRYGETLVATEDGSLGESGLVTDILRMRLSKLPSKQGEEGVSFYNCGPELMIENATRVEEETGCARQIQSLIERYTKCGVGLCGSCAIDGKRACVDGPVFTAKELSASRHFGKFKRDASGSLVSLKIK